ncbi:MFS transporter [Nocardioides sp. SOB44]|uniref:Multidrug efflux pump Tap n=1 Tax=Nocardioides cremeus TaxID=3058044 RepID=A0ABT8TSY3_9ACTN|nr:MFS transporter [Nocardioides cremeus]MDO3397062.1 MFS transporter [Nocardioides cremeus]
MKRPLYGWLLSDAVSLTGTRISMIAIPWFVLTTTGSATQTGLVAFAEMLPLVVAKVLGGPVIDRLGARRVAIACDVGSFGAVGLVPLLHALGWLSFPLLLALVAVAGALRGPGDAAKDSLTPVIVAAAQVPMERATGLATAVERGAGMVGFALAGALVVAVGPATALVANAGSFLVGGAILAWATCGLPRPDHAEDPHESPARYWQSLREGWSFLRREPVLLGLSLMIAVTNLLDLAWSAVLAPVWAVESGNGVGLLGMIFAVFAGSSVVGALIASAWGHRLPRFRTYILAYLICGLPRFLVMAADSPLWSILMIMVVSGVASGFLNPILGAVFYERIPNALVGRVSSLSTSMAYALMPLGGLVGAALIGGFGLSPALAIAGIAYLATTMAPTVVPSFREMNRQEPTPVTPHAAV